MIKLSSISPFESRQGRLRALLEKRALTLLVVTKPVNIFYLTGFRGSAGIAVFGCSIPHLWVDPRYALQAREQVQGVEVTETKAAIIDAVGQWVKRQRLGRANHVGVEDGHLTMAGFRSLVAESGGRIEFEPASGLIEELRAVKDPGEVEQIRKTGRLTSGVFEDVLRMVRPGLREEELATEIEYRMRRAGAEGAAFETIVASGCRAALPHARTSGKPLASGELVIFDLGAILAGYAADMTRTIYLGQPGRRVRRLFKAVLEAQQKAVEAVRAGVRAGDVDAAARRVLSRYRLDRLFTHSTGHGVGLEVHEQPRLGRRETARLRAGAVVTVEPGIYMEGFGGIRIEDTVLVGVGGSENLTPATKDGWILE